MRLAGREKRGKMAETPKAEEVCLWQAMQWQIYKARGLGRGVLKRMEPHWQEAFIFGLG